MLVLAPVMCIVGAIGINHILTKYIKNLNEVKKVDKRRKVKTDQSYPAKNEVGIINKV